MKKQYGFKVVQVLPNGVRLSYLRSLLDKHAVEYREGEWVEAHAQPTGMPKGHQKYGLFYFDNLEAAVEVLDRRGDDSGGLNALEVWEVEVEGVARKLPPSLWRLNGNLDGQGYIRYPHEALKGAHAGGLLEWSGLLAWPAGTKMARRLKLIKMLVRR